MCELFSLKNKRKMTQMKMEDLFWIKVWTGLIFCMKFQQLALKEGSPLSAGWETHVTRNAITNTHVATPTYLHYHHTKHCIIHHIYLYLQQTTHC